MAKRIANVTGRSDRRRRLRRVNARAGGGDERARARAADGATSDRRIGLRKDAIRRIVLEKLEVVYRDWNFNEPPFADFETEAGERREDARAFLIALVAGLLGGLSDAIEQNNKALAAALAGREPARRRRDA